jgi:exodeoxyribonuclease VII small subunit
MSDGEAAQEAQSFEAMMAALESLVARLESGDLPLEDALRAYEEGVSLVRRLNERLNDAERKIEVLSRERDGSLRVDEAEETE